MSTTIRIITMCIVVGLESAATLAAQQQFDTPDAAATALINAVENHQTAGLADLLGPGARHIMTSGDAAQDRSEQDEFVKLYQTRHELKPDPRDQSRVIIFIGDEEWPFPVPLVRRNGKWAFDSSESKVEMEARRIGTDELDAIEICAGYVDAQKQYASEEHGKAGTLTYASRIMSSPGTLDGLYGQGEGDMFVPRAFADAEWNGNGAAAKPYHGYYFRILYSQGPYASGGAHDYRVKGQLLGGFGLVAWPARYEVTGINTFIVNQDGVVYRKDIAPAANRSPVTRFDPDPTWSRVE